MFRLSTQKATWLFATSVFSALAGANTLNGSYSQTNEFGTSSGDMKFGLSVAMAGDEAIIATPKPDTAMWGYASVYRFDGSDWKLETSLTDIQVANNFGSYLGCSPVAIEGDLAVVGEPSANSHQGIISIFRRTSSGWSQDAVLFDEKGAVFDSFGCGVAISKGQVLVGAPNKNGIGQGYVYSYDGTRWKLDAPLVPVGAAAHDAVGFSASISGNEVVLGAPHAASDRGSAFIFKKSGTAWSQVQVLNGSDAAAGDQFGASVGISNGTIVVGAPTHLMGEGAAYVFAGPALNQLQRLSLSGTSFLGSAVAIDDSRIAVGRIGNNTVDFFGRLNGTWFKTEIAQGEPMSQFGGSVAISGPYALVGANAESGGRAYMLKDDIIFRDGMQ